MRMKADGAIKEYLTQQQQEHQIGMDRCSPMNISSVLSLRSGFQASYSARPRRKPYSFFVYLFSCFSFSVVPP
jgi:hypothetical protein